MILFATIFGVGFVLLIASLFFGGDGFDADMDHDIGHVDGPSIFSFRVISLLMVGFGAFAFGVRATTEASMFASSMSGVGGALVVGIIGYLIIRAFYSRQAGATIQSQQIVGQHGVLIDAIPVGGRGQVGLMIQGREYTFLARTADGGALGRDDRVRVVSFVGNIVVVEPVKE